ncbi:MAG: DUF4474 domain-containing protein [Bacilli bacterium]|nr:DUF4474 domain-containing protein [Bacilli bacterium]MDD4053653.1 DUF4474 domain-containing protein [Bacilli bacterium]MDD4411152.1 DUF4474 domain-containing protein [Bacilli bacterium]
MIKIGFILLFIFVFLTMLFFILYYEMKWLLGINVIKTSTLDIEELNKQLEPFGFAYNKDQDFFFSNMDAWQREYGYHKSYDEAAPVLSMIFDCEPITFKYNKKKRLIEFWKGQYGMTTGAEIGIYNSFENKPDKDNIFYKSITDEERLPMSYVLKRKEKILLSRNDTHWWLTGFKLGLFSKPSDLIMDIIISFENRSMTESFITGLKNIGYKDTEIKVINNSVHLTFDKPKTKQPKYKVPLVSYFMQKYNSFNCRLYNFITQDYDNALDKLNFIKNNFPNIFIHLLNIGKTKKIFK